MKKKGITAREIALSALSCAVATILLTLGIYSDFFLFSGYVLASVALMLPLAKNSYAGYFLAYVATAILTLFLSSFRFWEVLPFILFFGLHPIANEWQLKTKINRWVACAIKALWFDGTAYIVWEVLFRMTTSAEWLRAYALPIILVGGSLFFVFYDYVCYRCRAMVNVTVARIDKRKK